MVRLERTLSKKNNTHKSTCLDNIYTLSTIESYTNIISVWF